MMYQNELRKAGCLNDKKSLNMELFGEAFMTGKLDIQLLSNVLGGKELSDDLMNLQTEKAEKFAEAAKHYRTNYGR